MLDVHPPEHRIGSVYEFLLHLFTITCGLLIALALENGAEALHHRNERIEAEQTIRREITGNRGKLERMQAETDEEMNNLTLALQFLEDLRSGTKDDPTQIKLSFNVTPLVSAAWSTVSANGVLSYISYEQGQRFAESYLIQADYEAVARQALHEYEVLDTYLAGGKDPRTLKPQDIETAIPDVRRCLADLRSMSDIGRGTLKSYEEALHGK